MSPRVEVQVALAAPGLPATADFQRWVEAALIGAEHQTPAEVVIRLVNEAESAALNAAYRHKQGATNVLSFPFEAPPGIPIELLGDIVICAPVVVREAITQHKEPIAHWAHLVIHGVLHLLGYDHQQDHHAATMETMETRILQELGYPNPYDDLNDP